MRRRILIFLGVLVCLCVVIVASMPYWLGALTRSVGPRFGVTFSDYKRIGYGRAALTNVVYRGAGFQAKAERVEFASPIVWGWERATADGASVEVGKWTLTLDPSKDATAEKRTPNSDTPTGWLALRHQLRNAVAQIVNGFMASPTHSASSKTQTAPPSGTSGNSPGRAVLSRVCKLVGSCRSKAP